jgi:hypothetical protein
LFLSCTIFTQALVAEIEKLCPSQLGRPHAADFLTSPSIFAENACAIWAYGLRLSVSGSDGRFDRVKHRVPEGWLHVQAMHFQT